MRARGGCVCSPISCYACAGRDAGCARVRAQVQLQACCGPCDESRGAATSKIHQACALPDAALLRAYSAAGAYADCFVVEIAARVSFADYVEAFYTSIPFKLERLMLALLVAKPSSDADAQRLARGEAEAFAAWSVDRKSVV